MIDRIGVMLEINFFFFLLLFSLFILLKLTSGTEGGGGWQGLAYLAPPPNFLKKKFLRWKKNLRN